MGKLEERAWLARVLGPVGVVGAAFAVDGEHVMTCAHVVQAAGADGPGDVVSVEFPQLGQAECAAEVLVEAWAPEAGTAGDVALLRLKDPPAGVAAVVLRRVRSLDGVAFSAYGFPEGLPDGVWARGTLGLGVGDEWVQLEPGSARRVAPGFSGTAVWSDGHKAVVGMMVARDSDAESGVAFAIPVGVLARDSEVVEEALPTALELDPAAGSWDVSARGVLAAERGWLFTGRRRALCELVRWLMSDEPPAMRVVTGSPGCGKSAVLARLVTTSDRRYRREMPKLADSDPTVAPEGCVDVTFDAHGRTVSDFVAHVSAVCQLDARDVPDLAHELRGTERRLAVVLDGLDEATEPDALATSLAPLARAGCRVLVGCRPHLVGRLGDPDPISLDRPPWLEQEDIERYVARRLERQPVQAQDTEELVREVAAVASGNFLVAQLTADGIAYSGRAARPFPTDVAEAFRRRLDDLQDESVRELLLPLAYAVGEGLPEDLWLSGVAALSRPYERGDLRRLLRGPAGSFVLTTRDRAGQSGYRLFHQALAETLAAESTPEGDQRLLWTAWTGALPSTPIGTPRWEDAPGYLLGHAAEHAAAAGALAELGNDAGYLLHGDLYRLRLQLRDRNAGGAPETAAVLGLAAGRAQSLDADDRGILLALAARHLGLARTADALAAASPQPWRPVWAHALGPPHVILSGHTGGVNAVAFGRVGDRDLLATASDDRAVRLWDLGSGEGVGEPLTGPLAPANAVAFGRVAGRDLVASASGDGAVYLWDLASGDLRGEPLIGHDDRVRTVAFGRVGDRVLLASGGDDGTVRLWDPGSGEPVGEPLTGHIYEEDEVDGLNWVAFGRVGDRDLLATAGDDGTVWLWDPCTSQPVGEPLTGHTLLVNGVAFGRVGDRELLASAGHDKTVRLWEPTSRELVCEPLTGHADQVTAVAFGRVDDRDLLASASGDRTVRLWDPRRGEPVGEPLTGHTDWVRAVAFGRAGGRDLLASAGDDGTVRLWDPGAGHPVGEPLTGHTNVVETVAFGRVGSRDLFASAGDDATVRLWDPATGQSVGKPLTGHTDWVRAVAFGRAGGRDLLATGSRDGTVRLWDPVSGAGVGEPVSGDTRSVDAVAFARVGDRDLLASLDDGGTARLWDPGSGEPVGEPVTGPTAFTNVVAFGRVGDRDLFASGDWEGAVYLWDLTSGEGVGERLKGHSGDVSAVAFGQVGDRTLLASAGEDGTVRLWNPGTGQPVGEPLLGHADWVRAVAFGRVGDRHLLASAGDDATVRLWDPASVRELVVLPTVEPAVAVALSPHGVVVATGRALCLIAADFG